jgi:hypothetical protein
MGRSAALSMCSGRRRTPCASLPPREARRPHVHAGESHQIEPMENRGNELSLIGLNRLVPLVGLASFAAILFGIKLLLISTYGWGGKSWWLRTTSIGS